MFGFLIFISLVFTLGLQAQNEAQNFELSEQYFAEEEYDKALGVYEILAKDNTYFDKIYRKYLFCLQKKEDYNNATKIIQRQIKNHPENPAFEIDAILLQETQGEQAKAQKSYDKLIETIKKDDIKVQKAAYYLIEVEKIVVAEKLLLEARNSSKDPVAYAAELGDVYLIQNKKTEMMEEYINIALKGDKELTRAEGLLQDRLETTEDFALLEQLLLEDIQKSPQEIIYNELLLWLYLQQRLFDRAFVQAKALDRRYKQQGSQLLDIGLIALNNKDYKAATQFFEYIIEKYPTSPNYAVARHYFIKAKEEVVKNTFPVQEAEIRLLISEYESLINELGRNNNTLPAMRNMALLHAFYLNEKEKGIEILNQAVTLGGNNSSFTAECKIALGDIFLLKDEPWEATLLYAQVEKSEKETPIGHEAKLKNAKLSFYEGDFALAQEHLDILKLATSREISNDAIDLSLLIRDNLFLDTLGTALQEYADIELLLFQNQYQTALDALQGMQQRYPTHAIADEVLWKKANLLLQLGKPQEAIEDLKKLLQYFGQDILADDAHFLIGRIYEEYLQDKDKAMEYYKNHLIDYKGSIHVVEARKRFRILRGDFLNQ